MTSGRKQLTGGTALRLLSAAMAVWAYWPSATAESQPPEMQAARVEAGAIEVDGALDEEAWQRAKAVPVAYSLSQQAPTVQTTFRMAYDNTALYFAVWCEQPDMDGLVALRKGRDSGVYSDDSIEIFIQPDGVDTGPFQFVFNARGEWFDGEHGMGGKGSAWNAEGVSVATARGEAAWTLEVRVPFPNILPGKANGAPRWRINLGRNFMGGRPRHLTAFPMNGYKQVERYGVLEIAGLNLDAFRWEFTPVSITKVTEREDGGKIAHLSVAMDNASPNKSVLFSVRVRAPGEEWREVRATPEREAAEATQLTFSAPFTQPGNLSIRVAVWETARGRLLAWREFETPVTASPLALEVTWPAYRATVYQTMGAVSTVKLTLRTLYDPGFSPDDALVLTLSDGQGQLVARKRVRDAHRFIGTHGLTVPPLPPGDYVCAARLLRGAEERHRAEASLHVAEASPSEVRINEHLNFVVNGREFFPVGTFHSPWSYAAGEECNTSIWYRPAPDLNQDADPRLADIAKDDRWAMFWPQPASIWPHQVGGHHDLAKKPVPPEHSDIIAQSVRRYRGQPGLLAWYHADEPSTNTFLPEFLEGVADACRTNDPFHPVYISFNFADRVSPYVDAFDACGLHFYCGFTESRGAVYPVADIATQMDTVYAAVGHSKPVVFSPQLIIFSHLTDDQDIRPVTHDESRCMAYLSVVHGAKGIIWFASSGFRSSIEIRIGMPSLVHELRRMERVFLSHNQVEIGVRGTEAVHVLGKRLDDDLYIIAVNAAPEPAEAELTLPKPWQDIDEMQEIDSDGGHIPIATGRAALGFAPYQVRVLTTDADAPQFATREELRRRFTAEHERLMASGNLCYAGRGATVNTSPGFGIAGRARTVIDGYRDYCPEGCRPTKAGAWVEIVLKEPALMGRIEVSSNTEALANTLPGRFTDYVLEVQVGDEWQPVDGEVSERSDGEVLTRAHTFAAATVKALRLTTNGPATDVGWPNEIQAFAPRDLRSPFHGDTE